MNVFVSQKPWRHLQLPALIWTNPKVFVQTQFKYLLKQSLIVCCFSHYFDFCQLVCLSQRPVRIIPFNKLVLPYPFWRTKLSSCIWPRIRFVMSYNWTIFLASGKVILFFYFTFLYFFFFLFTLDTVFMKPYGCPCNFCNEGLFGSFGHRAPSSPYLKQVSEPLHIFLPWQNRRHLRGDECRARVSICVESRVWRHNTAL